MSATRPEIVGLGEVLWDLLPTGPQLGGAPLNFTFHCHQLGHSAVMVSRVGRDERGQAIREALRQRGLDDRFVQEDDHHPTGTVSVDLDQQGQPNFTIHTDVAYDHLAWDDSLEGLLTGAQGVCFGTLIQRSAPAQATVQKALAAARSALIVYDVNLRQQFYTREVIETSLHACRWAKLNDAELVVLADLLGLEGQTESARVASLRGRYDLELVALTRGANGCLVQTADAEVVEGGIPVQVVDTIGAGDAFTAGLLVAILEGRSVAQATAFANRLAARVASAAGGTPIIGQEEIDALRGSR
jgi:fructokinase